MRLVQVVNNIKVSSKKYLQKVFLSVCVTVSIYSIVYISIQPMATTSNKRIYKKGELCVNFATQINLLVL